MPAIPTVGLAEVSRLAGALARAAVTRQGPEAGLCLWLWQATARLGCPDFFLRVGRRHFLFVTGAALSGFILDQPPSEQGFVTGAIKRRAMSFLAPNALTILDGAAWTAMRRFNVAVLAGAALPETKELIRSVVAAQFSTPVGDIGDLRQRMGRVMLEVVLGPGVAADLADDVHALFAEVNLRTAIFGSREGKRRDRFRAALRRAWYQVEPGPTLLARAREAVVDVSEPFDREDMLVDQIPHWMFTFTDSGTTLVGRTMAMLRARPADRQRAEQDLGTGDDRLLSACLMETGRLFPPVSLITHTAARDVRYGETTIPAGTTILHYVPACHLAPSASRDANSFRPERFLNPQDPGSAPRFLTFLSGARACPGKDLILLVATEVLARQIPHMTSGAGDRILASDPLPLRFPHVPRDAALVR